jgi:hypothetical protein
VRSNILLIDDDPAEAGRSGGTGRPGNVSCHVSRVRGHNWQNRDVRHIIWESVRPSLHKTQYCSSILRSRRAAYFASAQMHHRSVN